MRLNEAMESIGDNSYVKNTLDQVQSQTDSIAEMEEASHNLEESINNISKTVGGIQDNTHEMQQPQILFLLYRHAQPQWMHLKTTGLSGWQCFQSFR